MPGHNVEFLRKCRTQMEINFRNFERGPIKKWICLMPPPSGFIGCDNTNNELTFWAVRFHICSSSDDPRVEVVPDGLSSHIRQFESSRVNFSHYTHPCIDSSITKDRYYAGAVDKRESKIPARPENRSMRRSEFTRKWPNSERTKTMRALECFAVVLFFLLLLESDSMVLHKKYYRIRNFSKMKFLPKVPSVVHPPVPDEARLSLDEIQTLQDNAEDPETRAGLFQGDMALTNEFYKYWRVGLRWDVFPEKLWPNNTVPYVISPLYDVDDYVTIYTAIRTINFMTCIKFVPWNGKTKDFLLIWPIKYPKGCWSFVGKFGGPQIVSLQAPDENGPNCLGNEGRSIHELLHALGIFHEQSRADRDQFVNIHLENVIPELVVNFDKQSLENTTYNFEYDYDSIMHYGRYFFSKEKGKPTITPKMPGVKRLGQRRAMSKTDCLKINDLYGCLTKNLYSQRKYYHICQNLGL